jgi:diguanylate cyclase (GGDEF)-like protein
MVGLQMVNRRAGHTIGDIVLKALAGIIVQCVRDGDVVGRVGGDEFVVIMPDAGPQLVRHTVEKIAQTIGEYRLDLGKKGTVDYVGCKTGTAVFPVDGTTPEAILVASQRGID